MLSCRDLAQKHASNYLDGQLNLRQRFSVRMHLLMCVSCRRFVNQLRQVQSIIRHQTILNTTPTDDEKIDQLAEQLRQELMAQKKSS